MKQILIPLLMICIVICSSSVFASTNDKTLSETVIDSKILGENRKLVIYLPEGYHGTKQSYPVLYITDGYAHGAHTAGSVDFLSKFDMAPKMIVVGIDNPRDKRYRDLTVTPQKNVKADSLSGADRFLAYIEKEVIPYISSHYRTLDYKALAGTSHGGQFAINALIKRPGLFDGTIAVSPSLYLHQYQLIGSTEAA